MTAHLRNRKRPDSVVAAVRDLRVTQALVVSVDRDSDVIASAGVHSTLQPRP